MLDLPVLCACSVQFLQHGSPYPPHLRASPCQRFCKRDTPPCPSARRYRFWPSKVDEVLSLLQTQHALEVLPRVTWSGHLVFPSMAHSAADMGFYTDTKEWRVAI